MKSAEETSDRLRLIRSSRVGPVTYRQLLRRFGTARAALEAVPDLARRGGGRGMKLADSAAVEREVAATRRFGADFLFLGDAAYPPLLARLSDAPPVLVTKGDRALLQRPALAMVGARNASAAACKLAAGLSSAMAGEGFALVSGLARGIDTAVHKGALGGASGRATVAVIAGGIDNEYPPENAALQSEIAHRALLISEMPFGTEPRARHFPHRNRIIAGLALGTLVVEAAPRSGSLITARLAGEAGREVMAIPGSPLDPRSRGCNDLIREGATLIQSAEDIVEALSGWDGTIAPRLFEAAAESAAEHREDGPSLPVPSPDTSPTVDSEAKERERVRDLLSGNYVGVDELVRQSGLAVDRVQLCLLELELAGLIDRGAGGRIRLNA